ncbi:MAG TPA: cytochrome c, partial [Pirellulales bacterium]|nr:cytochrome c [Pirellulales bacterium]
MKRSRSIQRAAMATRIMVFVVFVLALIPMLCAAGPWRKRSRPPKHHRPVSPAFVDHNPMFGASMGGTWYWMRSPEEEKQAASSLFNRYCIRCHGVDGRGVWDVPGIPNFTNVRFQASRSDDQLARAIMQGRGAVMPTFRGALTLEEAWALARYLRSFIPGSEVSRP